MNIYVWLYVKNVGFLQANMGSVTGTGFWRWMPGKLKMKRNRLEDFSGCSYWLTELWQLIIVFPTYKIKDSSQLSSSSKTWLIQFSSWHITKNILCLAVCLAWFTCMLLLISRSPNIFHSLSSVSTSRAKPNVPHFSAELLGQFQMIQSFFFLNFE